MVAWCVKAVTTRVPYNGHRCLLQNLLTVPMQHFAVEVSSDYCASYIAIDNVYNVKCIQSFTARQCTYRVFSKIGRVDSEEVTLQLIKSKCLPVLLYGLEACPLTKSDLQSLDFVIN